MKTLNCQRAAELLPLYAAGDLEDARAREVAAHVRSCADCRALAAGFDESRAVLAEACASPEFGEEFYAGIRGAVLAEIARDRARPSRPSLLAALLPARRLVFATSFALIVLAFAAALHFARRGANDPQGQLARLSWRDIELTRSGAITPQPAQITPQPAHDTPAAPAQGTAASKSRTGAGGRDDAGSRQLLIKHERATGATHTFVAKARRELRAAPNARREVVGEVANAQRTPAAPARGVLATSASEPANIANAAGVVNAANITNATGGAVASEVSRIEIQTADPNIRIIWLAPAKRDEPARDRDNHDNGDRK